MNKKLMYGLGIIAVVGIAYYIYNKDKKTTTETTAGNGLQPQEPTISPRVNIQKGVVSKVRSRLKKLKDSGKLAELQQQNKTT
jgi:hypothetical protein